MRVKELTDAHEAMDLSGFKYFTTKHIEQAREVLKNNWYPTIQNIFLSVTTFELFFGSRSKRVNEIMDYFAGKQKEAGS